MIPKTIQECLTDLKQKGVEISPEAETAIEINIDPATLEHTLVNYIRNAEDTFQIQSTSKVTNTLVIKGYKIKMVFRREKGLTKISAQLTTAT